MLWDGKTTQGWRGAKQTDFPKKGWQFKDGILTVEKAQGGEAPVEAEVVEAKADKKKAN